MNLRLIASIVTLAVVLNSQWGRLHAQCIVARETELAATNPVNGENFGSCVAVDGDTVFVGSPGASDAASNAGAVYVYRQVEGAWQQVDLLTASDASMQAHFGSSVAIDGDTLIAGASGANGAGAAYVFRKTNDIWQEIAKLTASDGATGDEFGFSVALSGNSAVIGAIGNDAQGDISGAAYVFREVGGVWQQMTRLIDPQPQVEHGFGFAVAIEGDTAMVGADYETIGGTIDGSVYVYRKINGEWQFAQELQRSGGARSENGFGQAISLDGDTAVAGITSERISPCNPVESPCNFGAAYVFRDIGGTWQVQAQLLLPDPINPVISNWEDFGSSVSISGDTIVVGAARKSDAGPEYGAAYLFKYLDGEWVKIARLAPVEQQVGDFFGRCVAINGATIGVGKTGGMFNSLRGGAHIFNLSASPDDCNANGISDDCDIAGSLSGDCNGNLIPDDCEPPLATLADFVTALLNASSDPFDVCLFDGDDSGSLDARDVEAFVSRLLNP